MLKISSLAWITYVCYPRAIVFTPAWKWPPRTFTQCACNPWREFGSWKQGWR